MGRAPCCDQEGVKKGPWTPEEDQRLVDYIAKHGPGRWRALPKIAGLSRCGKSCRLRWTNYLRPDIKRGRFSFEEEEAIIQLHSILGNKWSAIAARLPGRTDNEIKNYWNTHIRKRLLRMGIDPVTHSPRLDLLDLSSLLNPSLYSTPSQLEVSKLLGIEPVVNTELLRIVASLLSAQPNNLRQQQQLTNHNTHEQFQPSSLPEHLPDPLNDQIPVCTASSTVPLPDGAQLMQASVGQFHSGTDQANPWQNNGLACGLPDSLPGSEHSQLYSASLTMDAFGLLTDAPDLDPSGGHGFCFPSLLSTPASSSMLMNSSSPYIDGTTTTATTTTEDESFESDSYCSSLVNFQFPDLLDVSAFM